MWKSREDQLPPPSYFSMIVAYLQKAHDHARVSRELMETLRPYFIEAWRNGKSAEAAAQTTCSCLAGQIVPSPVVGVHLAKGTVRPPKDAQRGEVFGAEALRPPAAVERLMRRLGRLGQEQAKQEQVTARWAQRAQSARKESTQREAVQKKSESVTKHTTLMMEARRIEAEIKRLQGELHRPARRLPLVVELSPAAPVARTIAAPLEASMPVPAPAPAPAPVPAPIAIVVADKKERARPARRRSEEGTAPNQASSGSATPSTEGEAMLRAIQGLMPELAGQLVSEMAKGRSAK